MFSDAKKIFLDILTKLFLSQDYYFFSEYFFFAIKNIIAARGEKLKARKKKFCYYIKKNFLGIRNNWYVRESPINLVYYGKYSILNISSIRS